ncbi:unnamed protein product, partial [Pocillopora meandrina]
YTRVSAENNIRRRFVGTKSNAGKTTEKLVEIGANKRRVVRQIPDEIVNNLELQDAVRQLPPNYNFEIFKSVWRNILERYFKPIPTKLFLCLLFLYVFVDIKLDATHFVNTVRHNFEAGKSLALLSTIQFVTTLQVCIK